MLSIDWKNIRFYRALIDFKGRLIIFCFAAMIVLPLVEYLVSYRAGLYVSNWIYIIVVLICVIILLFFLLVKKIKTKMAVRIMVVLALLWSVFALYRVVHQDFNSVLLINFIFGVLFVSFLFDRKNLILILVSVIGSFFLVSLLWVDWGDIKHITYVLASLLTFLFIFVSFIVKAFRIWVLKMAEIMLVKFDKYAVVFDKNAELIFINPEMKKEYNIKHPYEFWYLGGNSEQEVIDHKNAIKKLIDENGDASTIERFMLNGKGEQIFVSWDYKVIGGEFLFAVGTNKTGEIERTLEQEKLLLVTRTLGTGILIVDSDGYILWCNDTVGTIFGYEQNELLGNRPSEVFEVPTFFKEEYAKIIARGIQYNEPQEMPHYKKDGTLIWILVCSSPIKSKTGEQEFVEVVTDITAQKQNEFQSKQISLIAERTRSPVIITDLSLTIMWMNMAFLSEFELNFEDVIGQNYIETFVNKDLNKGVHERIFNCVEQRDEMNVEILFTNDDRKQWFELSIDPIEDEHGKTNQYMFIMQNIQKLKSVNQLVEQKNRDIMDSINCALRIQKALLPSKEYLTSLLPKHFIYYKPKDVVSGDFYYVKCKRNRIFIAIADCTGHGVPGALVTSICVAALDNAILNFQLNDPSEILDQVDAYVDNALSLNNDNLREGMDIGMIVINPVENKLFFAGARRPLFVYLEDQNELIEYKGVKKSIGESFIDFDVDFKTHEISINQRINLYLFSDGITDQFGGEKNKKLRQKNITNFLIENNQFPMESQYQNWKNYINSWTNNFEIDQTDDMVFFGLTIDSQELIRLQSKELLCKIKDSDFGRKRII